jgi:hypothetical protein
MARRSHARIPRVALKGNQPAVVTGSRACRTGCASSLSLCSILPLISLNMYEAAVPTQPGEALTAQTCASHLKAVTIHTEERGLENATAFRTASIVSTMLLSRRRRVYRYRRFAPVRCITSILRVSVHPLVLKTYTHLQPRYTNDHNCHW